MASHPHGRQRIHPVIFLAYGLFALVITGALLGLAQSPGGLHFIVAAATPTPSASPTPTATPRPGQTPGPTATPAPTATPEPTPTPTPAPGPLSPNPNNPLNLPDGVQTAVVVFTTLSGIASLLRFAWDMLRGVVSGVNRMRRG